MQASYSLVIGVFRDGPFSETAMRLQWIAQRLQIREDRLFSVFRSVSKTPNPIANQSATLPFIFPSSRTRECNPAPLAEQAIQAIHSQEAVALTQNRVLSRAAPGNPFGSAAISRELQDCVNTLLRLQRDFCRQRQFHTLADLGCFCRQLL